MASTKTEKPAKPAYEQEFDAMKKIGRLLADLPDTEARGRVAAWVASNFGRAE